MKHTECKDCELSNGDCGHHFKMDEVTNYDIASLSACDRYGNCDFFKSKANPKGYTISRSDIKDHIVELFLIYSGEELANAILNAIDNAPTVPNEYMRGYEAAEMEYKRPQGEWVFHKDFNESCRYGCNQCGNLTNIPNNFCPNCGAKMIRMLT